MFALLAMQHALPLPPDQQGGLPFPIPIPFPNPLRVPEEIVRCAVKVERAAEALTRFCDRADLFAWGFVSGGLIATIMLLLVYLLYRSRK